MPSRRIPPARLIQSCESDPFLIWKCWVRVPAFALDARHEFFHSEERMKFTGNHFVFLVTAVLVAMAGVTDGRAQMAGMSAMENSVGFMSSGTSIEPTSSSETSPMVHTTLGNWAVMFHAN